MTYHIIEQGLTFGTVFDKLRNDRHGVLGMRLPKWSKDVVVRIHRPDTSVCPMTAAYLYVESRFGKVPWKETYIELFSDEWVLVDIIDHDAAEEEENKKEFPNEECSKRCLRGCIGECNNSLPPVML